jgi:hypothetical protein
MYLENPVLRWSSALSHGYVAVEEKTHPLGLLLPHDLSEGTLLDKMDVRIKDFQR